MNEIWAALPPSLFTEHGMGRVQGWGAFLNSRFMMSIVNIHKCPRDLLERVILFSLEF